jgi:hypothetical protein
VQFESGRHKVLVYTVRAKFEASEAVLVFNLKIEGYKFSVASFTVNSPLPVAAPANQSFNPPSTPPLRSGKSVGEARRWASVEHSL